MLNIKGEKRIPEYSIANGLIFNRQSHSKTHSMVKPEGNSCEINNSRSRWINIIIYKKIKEKV